MVACDACGYPMNPGSLFCEYCSRREKDSALAGAVSESSCSRCGKSLDADCQFCKYCGAARSNTQTRPDVARRISPPAIAAIAVTGAGALIGVLFLIGLLSNTTSPTTVATPAPADRGSANGPTELSREQITRDCENLTNSVVGRVSRERFFFFSRVDVDGISSEGANAKVLVRIWAEVKPGMMQSKGFGTGIAQIPILEAQFVQWGRDGGASVGDIVWFKMTLYYRRYDTGWRIERMDG